jgi:hypothetical protein
MESFAGQEIRQVQKVDGIPPQASVGFGGIALAPQSLAFIADAFQYKRDAGAAP